MDCTKLKFESNILTSLIQINIILLLLATDVKL